MTTPLFSKQEQEGRAKYISVIAETMSDDDVEVLAVLYRACRVDGRNTSKGVSIKSLADSTKRSLFFFRKAFQKLVFAHFAIRQKTAQKQCYSITQEEIDALHHLLDEKSFPRSALKINAILDAHH